MVVTDSPWKRPLKMDFNPQTGFLLAQVNKDEYDFRDETIRFHGETLFPKDELHITLLSYQAAEAVKVYIQDHTSAAGQVRGLIETVDWTYQPQDQYYFVQDEDGNQSIIQMVAVPQVQPFFEQLENLIGQSLALPPTHVTLYTHGNPQGIGIPDQETFDRLVKVQVDRHELNPAWDSTYHLLIFDVDGTLVEPFTLKFRPHVQDFFHLLFHENCSQQVKVALATNQGGVGMHYWLAQRNSKRRRASRFPSQSEVENRLAKLAKRLDGGSELQVYVSYRYQTKQGKLVPVPPQEEQNPRWNADWRKPKPGMLLQAMQDAQESPRNTLFVGDSEEDQQAADAAGCDFAWAKDFFTPGWSSCQQLDRFIQDDGSGRDIP